MDGVPLVAASGFEQPSPGDALVGRVLDRRYRLDRRIGIGSMGYVYQATHTLIGKSLAIKVLRDEHIGDAKIAERFAQEARLASRIKHPNVVEISDYGAPEDGHAYFVMELLEGQTLAHRVDTLGRLPPKIALGVAVQIGLGLGAAHEQGIVHRDLKAENVFLCEGPAEDDPYRVKLLDFGIARATGPRITVAGALLGTPEYMSPEQARGLDVDARTDLYALGIILFEMLTGRVPFASTQITETIRQHLLVRPPDLSEVAPDLDCRASERVIRRLLAKSPDERPSSATEVVALLHAAIERDFGSETAERVRRATMPLGSSASPERLEVRSRPLEVAEPLMDWNARTGQTQHDAPSAPPLVERDLPHSPRPGPPPLATTDPATLGAAKPKPRIGMVVAGTAAFAAAATFGVVAVLGGLGSPSVRDGAELPSAETYTSSPRRSEQAPMAAPASAVAVPVTSSVPEPSTPVPVPMPQSIPSAEEANPTSSDVGETPTSTDDRSAVEPTRPSVRSSPGHTAPKKTSARSSQPDPGKSTTPVSDDSSPTPEPAYEAPPVPANPRAAKKPSPGDLKDPFSPK